MNSTQRFNGLTVRYEASQVTACKSREEVQRLAASDESSIQAHNYAKSEIEVFIDKLQGLVINSKGRKTFNVEICVGRPLQHLGHNKPLSLIKQFNLSLVELKELLAYESVRELGLTVVVDKASVLMITLDEDYAESNDARQVQDDTPLQEDFDTSPTPGLLSVDETEILLNGSEKLTMEQAKELLLKQALQDDREVTELESEVSEEDIVPGKIYMDKGVDTGDCHAVHTLPGEDVRAINERVLKKREQANNIGEQAADILKDRAGEYKVPFPTNASALGAMAKILASYPGITDEALGAALYLQLKILRFVGNPDHEDTKLDLVGYATLIKESFPCSVSENTVFNYPITYKIVGGNAMVRFTGLTEGVVVSGDSYWYPNGYTSKYWSPHTDKLVWERVYLKDIQQNKKAGEDPQQCKLETTTELTEESEYPYTGN